MPTTPPPPFSFGIMARNKEEAPNFFPPPTDDDDIFPKPHPPSVRPSVAAGRGRRVRVEGHLTLLPRLKRRFSLYHFVLLRTNERCEREGGDSSSLPFSRPVPHHPQTQQKKRSDPSVGRRAFDNFLQPVKNMLPSSSASR